MKLGAKIIFSITIFFSLFFLLGGYALISYFYESTMEREVETAADQYQYNKFVVQANLITRGREWFADAAGGGHDIGGMASDMNGEVAFLAMDGSVLFSDFPAKTDFSGLLEGVSGDRADYRFMRIRDRMYLLVAGMVTHGDTGLYLVTGTDVERVLEQQEQIVRKFGAVYALAVGIGALIISGLSVLITRPIKQLTDATRKIADGDYGERVPEGGGDEVGQLARNFNRMALAVEEKVGELSENARQKEDFVANFAHELKTPLTSVIGYADRIYKKELPREEQKKAAWYIWNEGMRLEALSLKLMDLTLLNHREFSLQEMRSDILFRELASDVEYLMEEKEVLLDCSVEPAYIQVEYDLFKTLFLNLLDNAVKAGARRIQVTGGMEAKDTGIKDTERKDTKAKGTGEKGTEANGAEEKGTEKKSTEANSAEEKGTEKKSTEANGAEEKGTEKKSTEEKGTEAKGIETKCMEIKGAEANSFVEEFAISERFVIRIKDDGSGIPKQEIRRITEAFYMVDKSRSRKQHGAGIGLALAEKIAQIHGSSLEFESDGESGTAVSFSLKCKGVH